MFSNFFTTVFLLLLRDPKLKETIKTFDCLLVFAYPNNHVSSIKNKSAVNPLRMAKTMNHAVPSTQAANRPQQRKKESAAAVQTMVQTFQGIGLGMQSVHKSKNVINVKTTATTTNVNAITIPIAV